MSLRVSPDARERMEEAAYERRLKPSVMMRMLLAVGMRHLDELDRTLKTLREVE